MPESLDHYLKIWKLSDPQPLAETVTSTVYTVQYAGTTAVLKLLTPYGWEERRGAAALRTFDGRGAIRLYRADDEAQLLEYAAGDELLTLVERGEDAEATRIIVGVLRELHSVPQPTTLDGLFPLQPWFQELFKKAEADERAGSESIFVRGAKVAEKLLAEPREVRVLHGDIHHRNIRYHAERGWLAFDPKGVVGERTYDCANTLCNPPETPELVHSEARLLTNAGILAAGLEIELARVLAFTFAYACLSASWSLSIGEDEVAQWMLKVAAIVEPHVTQP